MCGDIALWTPIAPEAPFQTLVVWQNTVVSKDDDVETFFMDRCETRIKRVGCVQRIDGNYDFAFFVHDNDVTKFAIQRFLKMPPRDSPRWWEDIYFNNQQNQYPEDFLSCYPE